MHSTHFIYGYMVSDHSDSDRGNPLPPLHGLLAPSQTRSTKYTSHGRNEGSILFNDVFNTFYLWLYGVGHMVEDHSDSEKGTPLPPHGLFFPEKKKKKKKKNHWLPWSSWTLLHSNDSLHYEWTLYHGATSRSL